MKISWLSTSIALALIPLGTLCWFEGFSLGLQGSSSFTPDDDWLQPIALAMFAAGMPISVTGALCFVLPLVRRLKSDIEHQS